MFSSLEKQINSNRLEATANNELFWFQTQTQSQEIYKNCSQTLVSSIFLLQLSTKKLNIWNCHFQSKSKQKTAALLEQSTGLSQKVLLSY